MHSAERMRKGIIIAALVSAGMPLHVGRAEACGQSHDYTGLIVMAIGVPVVAGTIDLSFTIHDAAVDKSSAGASIAEIFLTVPQVVFGVWLSTKMTSTSDKAAILVATAWPAALTVHGLYSLSTADPNAADPAPPPPRRTIQIIPSAISDGTNLAPGLLAVGRF